MERAPIAGVGALSEPPGCGSGWIAGTTRQLCGYSRAGQKRQASPRRIAVPARISRTFTQIPGEFLYSLSSNRARRVIAQNVRRLNRGCCTVVAFLGDRLASRRAMARRGLAIRTRFSRRDLENLQALRQGIDVCPGSANA